MRIKRNLMGLVCFVLLLSMPAFGQSNLSLKELKDQYNFYNKIVNDPDIFWIIPLKGVYDIYYNDYNPDRNDRNALPGNFISREKFEKLIVRKIIILSREPLEEKAAMITDHFNASQKAKEELRKTLLVDLEKLIRKHENSPNAHVNSNNSNDQTNNTSSNSPSFNDTLEKMTSDEHLSALSFDNIMASSNGNAIQDSQIDSFDGNWNEAINDNYSSCPKTKPDDRSSFRAYPNGQTSGNTYRNCVYFGNGYLKREAPYVNGKLDGLKTSYIWSDEYNSSYASTRENYSNGKRNGLYETYLMSRKGAVYRMLLTTYSDGMQHGDGTQWYENGQTKSEEKYFEGKIVLQHNYRQRWFI